MENSIKSTERCLDVSKLTFEEFQYLCRSEDQSRREEILRSIEVKKMMPDILRRVVPMTFFEDFCSVCVFAFGVPGSVFIIPVLFVIGGLLVGSLRVALILGLVISIPLAIMPVPFQESSLSSWLAYQVVRYFSYKVVYDVPLQKSRPSILVAPPHGVFPFGNIVTMISFPSIMGYYFHGLAASAAVKAPFFRQVLCTIGAIDANRKSAARALKKGISIGISTGGVAEVFETNSPSGDEVILLRSRKGLVRLAFANGADLVPCYLFGNTHLLSLWSGGKWGHSFLKKVSRAIGFALVVFWGRFGLPIPYREPIFGVMGTPIEVPKKENPSEEEIKEVHEKLIQEMIKLFDKHKASYGWADKKLIIE